MAPGTVQSRSVVAQRQPPPTEQAEQIEQRPSSPDDPSSLAQLLSSSPEDPGAGRHRIVRALAVCTFAATLVALGLILLNPDANPTSVLVDRVSAWLESRNAPPRLGGADRRAPRQRRAVRAVRPRGHARLATQGSPVVERGRLPRQCRRRAGAASLPARSHRQRRGRRQQPAGAFAGALLAAILLAIAYTVLGLTRVARRSAQRRRLRYA